MRADDEVMVGGDRVHAGYRPDVPDGQVRDAHADVLGDLLDLGGVDGPVDGARERPGRTPAERDLHRPIAAPPLRLGLIQIPNERW